MAGGYGLVSRCIGSCLSPRPTGTTAARLNWCMGFCQRWRGRCGGGLPPLWCMGSWCGGRAPAPLAALWRACDGACQSTLARRAPGSPCGGRQSSRGTRMHANARKWTRMSGGCRTEAACKNPQGGAPCQCRLLPGLFADICTHCVPLFLRGIAAGTSTVRRSGRDSSTVHEVLFDFCRANRAAPTDRRS
jgi:hypothetical protein